MDGIFFNPWVSNKTKALQFLGFEFLDETPIENEEKREKKLIQTTGNYKT